MRTSNEYSCPSAYFTGFLTENEDAIIIEHRGGEALNLKDTKIILWKGHEESFTLVFDSMGIAYGQDNIEKGRVVKESKDGFWSAGEYFEYPFGEDLGFRKVRAIVIDTVSNFVVASGTIQTGRPTYLPTTPEENGGG